MIRWTGLAPWEVRTHPMSLSLGEATAIHQWSETRIGKKTWSCHTLHVRYPEVTTRWTTRLSSNVNHPEEIDCSAVYGIDLVT